MVLHRITGRRELLPRGPSSHVHVGSVPYLVGLGHQCSHRYLTSHTHPQNLVEYIVRQKIYQTQFWKEKCFALTAESLLEVAVDLRCVGGTCGGQRKPSDFLCLILKMLQIQPDKEIIIEYIKNEDFKYVRLLGARGTPGGPLGRRVDWGSGPRAAAQVCAMLLALHPSPRRSATLLLTSATWHHHSPGHMRAVCPSPE